MQDKELLNILDIFIKEKNQIIEKIKKERKKLIPKINIIEYSMYPEILRNQLLYDILKVNFVIDNNNKEIKVSNTSITAILVTKELAPFCLSLNISGLIIICRSVIESLNIINTPKIN